MSPSDVERKLAEWEPPGPSARLDARIERSIHAQVDASAARPGSRRSRWPAAGVAAGLMLAGLAGLAVSLVVRSGPATSRVAVGDPMPTFRLHDATGGVHALEDYRGRVLVLGIGSPRCPWWRSAQVAVRDLRVRSAGADVAFLAVASDPRASAEEVAGFVEREAIDFPILIDASSGLALRLGVAQTPEFYVVGRDGTVVYRGAFDDRKLADGPVERPHVALALASLSRGEPVSLRETPALGCPIPTPGAGLR